MSATGSDEDAFFGWKPEEVPKGEVGKLLALRALERARAVRQSSSAKPVRASVRTGDVRQLDRWVWREMRIAQVPEEYRNPSWSQCPVAADLKPWCQGITAKAKAGRGLILSGTTGTGKSSSAGLICRAAIEAKLRVHWAYVPTMLRDLQEKDRRQKTVNQVIAADLVIWDDFGAKDPAEWEIELLDELVEQRHSRKKSLVVTTNWSGERLKSDQRLARMVDRWRQRMPMLYLVGKSQRGPQPVEETVDEQQTLL